MRRRCQESGLQTDEAPLRTVAPWLDVHRKQPRMRNRQGLRSEQMPRVALTQFGRRMCAAIVLIFVLFGFAAFIYVRRHKHIGNPLLVFAVTCSITGVIAAAIVPKDTRERSHPMIVLGLAVWSFLCFSIAVYEWAPRAHETEVRTSLRRATVTVFTLGGTLITILYSAELITSSWGALRTTFIIAGASDLLHTMAIHLLYVIDPASQPMFPIAHTSGVRVGPPTTSSYLPLVYIVGFGLLMNESMRERISRCSGVTKLVVGLGQLKAGELPESPPPATRTTRHSEVESRSDSRSACSDSLTAPSHATQPMAGRTLHTRCDDALSDMTSNFSELNKVVANEGQDAVFHRPTAPLPQQDPAQLLPRELPPQQPGQEALATPCTACLVLPVYSMLPDVGRIGKAAHEAMRARVAFGRLVDEADRPLAPEAEALACFVLEAGGALLIALEDAPNGPPAEGAPCVRPSGGGDGVSAPTHSHSSLSRGAPVAAAGLMRIQDGRLLHLSNESEQYAPPPSCLAAVMSLLAGLGLESVETAQLHSANQLTQPEARPRPIVHSSSRVGRSSSGASSTADTAPPPPPPPPPKPQSRVDARDAASSSSTHRVRVSYSQSSGGDIAPWSKRPLWRRIGGRRGVSMASDTASAAGSSAAGSESGWETPEVERMCDERDAALTQTLDQIFSEAVTSGARADVWPKKSGRSEDLQPGRC